MKTGLIAALLGALILVILIAAVTFLGSTTSNKDQSASSTLAPSGSPGATGSPSPAAGSNIYALGQPGKTSDITVTINKVSDPFVSTNSFDSPDAGMRYIAVDMSVANNTSTQTVFSILAQVELQDPQGRSYTPTLAGSELPQIDGDIQASATRRGYVVFQVPATARGFTLLVKGSFTSNGARFALR